MISVNKEYKTQPAVYIQNVVCSVKSLEENEGLCFECKASFTAGTITRVTFPIPSTMKKSMAEFGKHFEMLVNPLIEDSPDLYLNVQSSASNPDRFGKSEFWLSVEPETGDYYEFRMRIPCAMVETFRNFGNTVYSWFAWTDIMRDMH